MNIPCFQSVRMGKTRIPLEKTPIFPALRLDFWKEHDKLLIGFDTQNNLTQETIHSKNQGRRPRNCRLNLLFQNTYQKPEQKSEARGTLVPPHNVSSAEPEVR